MPLHSGHKLSHYEVVESIGAGGMGEVYRARDTKLGRDVAVKVLPEEFARDKERLDRFEREARLLAQLNHPNIATLHGLEEYDRQKFLVMELVEGETLADRIAQGPVPVDEAIPLFIQIAEGLEAAHERGIVHRDLKPANIKIGPDGKPKILDFGLATALAEAPNSPDLAESPTVTRGTAAGVILGTAHYMSPEQARGATVDKRTDIWSFGCCLYEALTGKKAFQGRTLGDIVGSVLRDEPDLETLPLRMRGLVVWCLQKDPRARLRDIGDSHREFEDAGTTSVRQTNSEIQWASRSAIFSLCAVAILSGLGGWLLSRPFAVPSAYATRSVIPLPAGSEVVVTYRPSIAMSPDGSRAAFVARQDGSSKLFLRELDNFEATPVQGSDGAIMPFFSPDSQWLGFYSGGRLRKVSVRGGAPSTILETGDMPRGASWGEDDWIVFSSGVGTGLTRVSSEGGPVEVLTVPDRDRREKTHRFPEVLPGAKAVLFTLGSADITSFDDAAIAVLSLETGVYKVLIEGGTNPHYSSTGHIVYGHNGALQVIPFDVKTLTVSGAPVSVVKEVVMTPLSGNVEAALSQNGSLLYAHGDPVLFSGRALRIDRNGHRQPLVELAGLLSSVPPAPSPNGSPFAVWAAAANDTVAIYEPERGTLLRLVSGFDNRGPIWRPSGNSVTYISNRDGAFNIYGQLADGSAPPERLTTSEYDQYPGSWSPDGLVLAFDELRPETGWDIWVLQPASRGEPQLFLQSKFDEQYPQFSPDGEWVAYESNESEQTEIYVRSFPNNGRRWQVSVGGGTLASWSPNGRELFYRNGDGLLSVNVHMEGDELRFGAPKVILKTGGLSADYWVEPDGAGFVFVEPSEKEPTLPALNLVTQWGKELKRLVPTNN